ncbi:hypothetical protein NQ036_06825 [Brevibacterium sp. 91QC2O2]|uniref:P22 phage major capsid protein family protein n=1 Tax=Brevibacterium sp. 91QC2O2 TaxID=2968458 RepID=UPI00211C8805|nr:phage capsid protein [Brevibacterium sp. 91QC2O2]MCQ9367957.1 hypothetical protein [Brevibacterium sp. 91QC2O2]
MSIEKFIPEVWASKMLLEFQRNAIFAGLTNREYEGDLTRGQTVHIVSPVPVKIKDYAAAGRTTTADDIQDTEITMTIDQEKSFDFYVDDIDKAQSVNPSELNVYAQSASYGLVQDADQFLANLAVKDTKVPTSTVDPADVRPGNKEAGNNAFNVLRDLRKALNKADVPAENRVFVANAEFEALLLSADSKLTSADTSGTTSGLRSAAIGNILGFTGFTSNNLTEVDKPQVIAFHRSAIAYVSQIEKTEAMRAENKFADRLRGLHVYGGKLVRPEAIVKFTGVEADIKNP